MVIAVFCRGYRWALRVNCLVELVVKNMPANASDLRDAGLILDSGRSPGGGCSLWYSFYLFIYFYIVVVPVFLPGELHGLRSQQRTIVTKSWTEMT